MDRKIKSFHTITGIRRMSAAALVAALLGFNYAAWHDIAVPVFAILAAYFALGATNAIIGQRQKQQLARLKQTGRAYAADSIDYAPLRLFGAWVGHNLTFRATFTFTDEEGATHTTKIRRFMVGLGGSDTRFTPLDDFEFAAKIYVNPDNPQDYAVDLRIG